MNTNECIRCRQYNPNNRPFRFIDNMNDLLKKRFGSLPCKSCVIEIIGGEKKFKALQSIQIIKEMGL